MKKILIVTEHFDVGGVETYIQGQVRVLRSEGCQLHLVAGHVGAQAQMPEGLASVHTGLDLSGSMSTSAYLRSVASLRDIVREHAIDCIHAHPFGSFVVAQTVAEQENLGFVLTLHGPASLLNYASHVERFLLSSVILPHADLVLVVSSETQSLTESFVIPERLRLQNNVVPLFSEPAKWVGAKAETGWLVVSRLDSIKIVGIEDFVEKAVKSGVSHIRIAGDGEGRAVLSKRLQTKQLEHYVEFLGIRHDIETLMRESVGVAGMGRVLLEGLSLGLPVLLLGYDGVKGCVDESLFGQAAYANFSGRNLPVMTTEELQRQIADYLRDFQSLQSVELVAEYEEGKVWREFYQQLKRINPARKKMLSRCHHELQLLAGEDEEPLFSNNLFFDSLALLVTAPYVGMPTTALQAAFSYAYLRHEQESINVRMQHLQKSNFQLEESVSQLKDAIEVLRLQESESQIKEGKIAAMEQFVSEQHAISADQAALTEQLQSEIQALKSSTSWRITRPLRGMARLLRDPKSFWRNLQDYRAWKTARQPLPSFEVEQNNEVDSSEEGITSDLSWPQFEANVLAFREQYKGVFVQSAVIDWNVPLYQRPQHLAKALGRMGYLVIYETHCWACDDVTGARYMGDNVWLVHARESNSLKGVLRSFYSTAYGVLNEYGPHMLEDNVVVYEYIDHIDPAISGDNVAALNQLKDMAFGGDADYIVASSRALVQESVSKAGADKVVFIANGVDCEHYRRDWSHVVLPEKYTQFLGRYKRIVGYFGALAPWLWYEVMGELAQRLPDHGFVYIGPDYYGGSEKLPKTDNVLWLGPIDYAVLPAYAKCFEIAIIPFEPGEIARTTSPLKLFEYFALEVPVVVTSAMDECTCYPEVFAASSADEYLKQIARAFAVKDDPAYRDRMRQLANENDWTARAMKLEPLFPK